MRAPAVREFARRVQAGEQPKEIAAGMQISMQVARRKFNEIAAVLGIATTKDRNAAYRLQVCELSAEGLTDAEIGARLNRSIESVAQARRKSQGPKYRVVRLTPVEHETIDRMLVDGYNQHEIAREVGCDQKLVSTRAKKLDRSTIRQGRPPCECGRPAGHGGFCRVVVDPAYIRHRLLDGATAAEISREHNRAAQNFKPIYVQPVIDQLTAEGHRCACGESFGHRFVCAVTVATQRRVFSEEERTRATEMVRQGASVHAVLKALSLSVYSGNKLVSQIRAKLAEEGERCACGKPFGGHRWTCSAQHGQAKRKPAFRFSSATAANMTWQRRRKVSDLAQAGHGCKAICERTGETEWRVDQLIAELRAAGLTPDKCVGCENPFNHRGPCLLPKMCECGRWRRHRGPCRGNTPKPLVRRGDKAPTIDPAARHQAMLRYRDGHSIRRISEATGISFSKVQRLIAYWRKRSHHELKPCVCGRPARHPGGCIKNTPQAVSKLEHARIIDGTRAGELPHHIAERLGLHVQTVLKHSAEARKEMFAAGTGCACGRPVGHPYWCSAKWDAHEQPRGRRPFPEPHEAQAIEALVRGDIVADIAKAARVGTGSVWRLRKSLGAEQRAQRTKSIRARIARAGVGRGEEIMARIKAAVRRGIDPVVRDDIEAEIYLAVIEGRIETEQIKSVVKRFISRGLSEWQSNYGPKSLDATLGPDDGRALIDLIRDDTSSGHLEEIEIGNGDFTDHEF